MGKCRVFKCYTLQMWCCLNWDEQCLCMLSVSNLFHNTRVFCSTFFLQESKSAGGHSLISSQLNSKKKQDQAKQRLWNRFTLWLRSTCSDENEPKALKAEKPKQEAKAVEGSSSLFVRGQVARDGRWAKRCNSYHPFNILYLGLFLSFDYNLQPTPSQRGT